MYCYTLVHRRDTSLSAVFASVRDFTSYLSYEQIVRKTVTLAVVV